MLSKLDFDKNTIYVFDKGYNDYKVFEKFCNNQTGFVTRIKDNAVYELKEELLVEDCIDSGVISDEIIEFCRINLFNYIHLLRFIENQEKDWRKKEVYVEQLSLF